MDNKKYQEAFSVFVREKLTSFYSGVTPWYVERAKKPAWKDPLSYFFNHWDRFKAMIEVCDLYAKNPVDLCEIGSFFPYTTFAYKVKNPGVKIDMYDIILRELANGTEEYDVDGVRLIDFNLCTDTFPENVKYDLITLSEVMEHVPMNLFTLQDNVIKLMKPGSFLLVTYPMHGHNAKDYDKDMTEYDFDKLAEGHLREFNEKTVPLFFKELTKVHTQNIDYWAYGRIKICMYQR